MVKVGSMSGTNDLRDLLSFWNHLHSPLSQDTIRRGIGDLRLRRQDVDDWVEFSEAAYQRILIDRTPDYEALLLCWRSGHRSPIHDHAGSICGVRVIEGTATETTYAMSPCGYLVPTGSQSLVAGSVSVSVDVDVHQLANLAPAGHDLITLHVYSPPLSATRTYSIGETTLADHDRLAALRPHVLTRTIRADTGISHGSNTPRRASQVRL